MLATLPKQQRAAVMVQVLLAASSAEVGGQEASSFMAELLRDASEAGRLAPVVGARWADMSAVVREAFFAALLADTESGVAWLERAGPRALAHVTVDLVSRKLDGEERSELEAALIDRLLARSAAMFHEHRVGAVLDVVVRVAHAAGPEVRAWLGAGDDGAHLALRSSARVLSAEAATGRVVRWLGVPALASAARSRVDSASDSALIASIAECWHLLRARGRASEVRRLTRGGALIASAFASASATTRRGALVWSEASPLKPEKRAELLGSCVGDSSAEVRLEAVRRMRAGAASPALDAITCEFTFDADPTVALSAASMLADATGPHRRRALAPQMRLLCRSPHASVRRLARGVVSRDDPWAGQDGAGKLWCPIAARWMLERDREGFIGEMRERFAASDPIERRALLQVIERLRLEESFEDLITGQVACGSERTVSKAALLLRRCRSEASRSALEEALAHAAPRVRANAIEALGARCPGDGRFGGWLADDAPRIRANAIRHVMRTGERERGLRALAEMLGDDRVDHRLAALWVAERMRAVEIGVRMADVTRRDADHVVRARAAACARTLLVWLRRGWQARVQIGVRPVAPRESGVAA